MSMIHGANTREIDIAPLIDGLCWLLARWGVASDRVPHPKKYEIGYRVGVGKNNRLVRFIMETKDQIGLDFEVDVVEVLKAGNRGVDSVIEHVSEQIAAARARRYEAKRIELDAVVGKELGKAAPGVVAEAKARDRVAERDAATKTLAETLGKPHPIAAAVASLTRNPGSFTVPGPETKQ